MRILDCKYDYDMPLGGHFQNIYAGCERDNCPARELNLYHFHRGIAIHIWTTPATMIFISRLNDKNIDVILHSDYWVGRLIRQSNPPEINNRLSEIETEKEERMAEYDL